MMLGRLLFLLLASLVATNAHSYGFLATCQQDVRHIQSDIKNIVKKASDAGTLSQGELTAMNKLIETVDARAASMSPNQTIASCEAIVKELREIRLKAQDFAASATKVNPVAPCLAKVRAVSQEIEKVLQQARTGANISPIESEQLKQMVQELTEARKRISTDGITIIECNQFATTQAALLAKANAFVSTARDPKLPECLARLKQGKEQLSNTMKQALSVGNPSAEQLEEIRRMREAAAKLEEDSKKDGMPLADCELLNKRIAEIQARATAFAGSSVKLNECRAKLVPVREEIVNTTQEAVSVGILPVAQIEEMKQLSGSALKLMQTAAKDGLSLSECEGITREFADVLAKIRRYPKPDPKVVECRNSVIAAREKVSATINSAMQQGNPSPEALANLRSLRDSLDKATRDAQQDGTSLKDCQTNLLGVRTLQAKADEFAKLGVKLAECRARRTTAMQTFAQHVRSALAVASGRPEAQSRIERISAPILQRANANDGTLEQCEQMLNTISTTSSEIDLIKDPAEACRQGLRSLEGEVRSQIQVLQRNYANEPEHERKRRVGNLASGLQECCSVPIDSNVSLQACRVRTQKLQNLRREADTL